MLRGAIAQGQGPENVLLKMLLDEDSGHSDMTIRSYNLTYYNAGTAICIWGMEKILFVGDFLIVVSLFQS